MDGTAISDYCPLDLFSPAPERHTRALQHLLQVPQNNLRVFVEGELLFPVASPGNTVWLERCQRAFSCHEADVYVWRVGGCAIKDDPCLTGERGGCVCIRVVRSGWWRW